MTTAQLSPVQSTNAAADRAEARQAVITLAYGIRASLFSAMLVWAYCAAGTRRESGELLLVAAAAFIGSVAADYLIRTVCRLVHTE